MFKAGPTVDASIKTYIDDLKWLLDKEQLAKIIILQLSYQ